MPAASSIIVLCHNALEYTRLCLPAAVRHTRGCELIVVDNGSSDGTPKYLSSFAAKHPQVRLILNGANLGFARGNNQAIRQARGENIVLLNSDAVVTPGWLDGLLSCAERDSSIAAVGPVTNNASDPRQRVKSGCAELSRLDAFARRHAHRRRGSWSEVHRLIGFCLLLKRSAVERVGLLDERFYPGGYEDYDYCLRLRQAGYKIALAEDVYVHHFGQRSYVSAEARLKAVRANREVFLDKWCRKTLEFLDDLDVSYGQA